MSYNQEERRERTAVEWLFYRMIMDKTLSEKSDFMHEAKEMEKEQRIKDIDFGHGIPSWANINYEAYFELSNKNEPNKSE